jgi:hypothetical protein
MPRNSKPMETVDVWSVEGRLTQLIYSPKGAVEGLLIDSDGIATQFVVDRDDDKQVAAVLAMRLRPGQHLVLEGVEQGASPKGEAEHTVYALERVVSVDGEAPGPAKPRSDAVQGKVVRFNYARHGAANGVVLDTGDFVHTRPEGLARLGLKIGDRVKAEGETRPLATGDGRVVEATSVNGKPVAPRG